MLIQDYVPGLTEEVQRIDPTAKVEFVNLEGSQTALRLLRRPVGGDPKPVVDFAVNLDDPNPRLHDQARIDKFIAAALKAFVAALENKIEEEDETRRDIEAEHGISPRVETEAKRGVDIRVDDDQDITDEDDKGEEEIADDETENLFASLDIADDKTVVLFDSHGTVMVSEPAPVDDRVALPVEGTAAEVRAQVAERLGIKPEEVELIEIAPPGPDKEA